jgi:hypothetical protein
MGVRIMTYIGLLYQDLIKSRQIKSGDKLPPVFPLVLYNGGNTWTAHLDIAELISPVSSALARYRPSLRYFLLDERRIPSEALNADSLAACLMRIERNKGTESVHVASFKGAAARQIQAVIRKKSGQHDSRTDAVVRYSFDMGYDVFLIMRVACKMHHAGADLLFVQAVAYADRYPFRAACQEEKNYPREISIYLQ